MYVGEEGMDNRSLLNSIYEPLDRTGRTVLKEVRELGYTAALNYYNLHEEIRQLFALLRDLGI